MDDAPRLNTLVQAIEFDLAFDRTTVKFVVPADDLQELFGAGDSPDDWMAAYRRHKGSIHKAAKRIYMQAPALVVVLRRKNIEPFLRPAAE
jgi:hypothetical protein